jgi:hypothetical protein
MKHIGFSIVMGVVLAALVTIVILEEKEPVEKAAGRGLVTKSGVCPPFFLYDEQDSLINPRMGIRADRPLSPHRTCGKCHDYEKITRGFHFQQGKDEPATGTYAERYQWALHPGNYGGNWCSPAPLYNYLSPKTNSSAAGMDMTSFTFITNGCGTCHPGGGPLEVDRNGNRYDRYMDSVGYEAGGINDFDGDYYKAHWNRSGVVEGDCNLCHLPEYDYKTRNSQLMQWNFRWLATAGSGLARVTGSIKDSVPVSVVYDTARFDKDGRVSMHLVREPRNDVCLNCHAKPGWKKRGASFSAQTDVHIAAGMKCVDCHPAGSMSASALTREKEGHQFGKGDDPSGFVRDDLDNTVRSCEDCHIRGYLNAPIAKHSWLPSLHLTELSCQACHIPARRVKAAQVQTSDVYNPGTKITPPPKHIWTFYDQDMNYWNHYGELAMFTAKDQPADPYRPRYARYKGRIFPVNPVHSAWPAIQSEGKPGLHQPRMKDVYDMWAGHRADPSRYPELSIVRDDNGDSISEVNAPPEIDAFLASVSRLCADKGYDLAGKRIVWVNNDRVYTSGTAFTTIAREPFESSPYASVYKYSHDVFPARAGLGSKGCVECHSLSSWMFYGQVVRYPFGEDGKPIYESQHRRLGIGATAVWLSAIREEYVKTFEYPAAFFLGAVLLIAWVCALARRLGYGLPEPLLPGVAYGIAAIGLAVVYIKPDLNSYILPDRLWLDKNHFVITVLVFAAAAAALGDWLKNGGAGAVFFKVLAVLLALACVSGGFMLIKFDAIKSVVRISYTLLDVAISGMALIAAGYYIWKRMKQGR